jgi:hypothetical protein
MEQTMQAMQSSTAAGTWCREEEFAALRYISQHLGVDAEETPRRRRMDESGGGGRESGGDGDLIREAGELLGILHLNGTLLVRPELRVEETNALRAELGELINRSWELLEQLLEFSHERDIDLADAEGPVFLKGLAGRGLTGRGAVQGEVEGMVERRPVQVERAGAGVSAGVGAGTDDKRGWVLEEGAAGWIAC